MQKHILLTLNPIASRLCYCIYELFSSLTVLTFSVTLTDSYDFIQYNSQCYTD